MNDNDIVALNKDLLKKTFDEYQPALANALSCVENKLKSTLVLASMPTFKSRIKKFNSFYKKLLRVRPETLGTQDLPVLTDLIGIRVICAFLEDLSVVEKQIKEKFNVIEVERKGAGRSFCEFGYESIHILIELPEECHVNNPLPNGLVCEIQIRTILQDAWAEVEHELVYKSEFSPFGEPLKRKLAAMNASLTLSDIIFQEIRDYQNKLNKEVDCRRNAFYEKADLMSHDFLENDIGITSIPQPVIEKSPYEEGTIDDLILAAIHAHNSGELDKAIEIYSHIIESKPSPNNVILSVIYKHRGMAQFAKSFYDRALEDFKKSVECDENNTRSYYYIGIIYSVINNNEKAVEFYSKSLQQNQYQAHVYYRKALALYKLSRYEEALSNLNSSASLGMSTEDSNRLRQALLKKLDMQ